jgi:uncharacterized protein (TIGR03083 family)
VSVRDYSAVTVPWPAALEWTRRELRRYLSAAADPARHSLATRCPPWTVRDLTAHLATTFQRFADMLDHARAGNLDDPFPPDHLTEENLRAVRGFSGDPIQQLDRQARRFLDSVDTADERMPHQFGPVPVGVQVMFGLNELAVHHDDLAHACGNTYRPTDEVVTALATVYDVVFGLPPGDDSWARLLAATGRGRQ